MTLQVFLGDVVTLMKDDIENPAMVTGQVSGVVLTETRKLDRVYIHGIDTAFWMHDGWKFIEADGEDDDAEI